MMFSTRAEYGVRVMVALANEQVRDGIHATPASLSQIADDNGLPFAYLEHLAARLKKAGLVESRRGPRGGYLLAQQAEDITMAQIVEALEGGELSLEDSLDRFAEGITLVKQGKVTSVDVARGGNPGRLMAICEDRSGAVLLYSDTGQLSRCQNG